MAKKRTPRTSIPVSLPDPTLAYIEAIATLSGESINAVIVVLLAVQMQRIIAQQIEAQS